MPLRLFLLAPLLVLGWTGCSTQLVSPLPLPDATWDAGVRPIPTVPTQIELAAAAIEERGPVAIQEAIDAVVAPGAVLLPAGTFRLDAPIAMRSGVVLRGAGAGVTHLQFTFANTDDFSGAVRPAFGAIRFEGTMEALERPLTGGHDRDSIRLELSATDGLAIGDTVLVFSENDPALMYTDPRWNAPWAIQSLGQIVQITRIKPGYVLIDRPLRLDFRAELRPRLRRLQPIEWAGVEDLTLESTNPGSENLIGLEVAENCWVRNGETVYTGRGHIWINFSRFITIEGNEVHHAFDYGGGGNGYGIVAGNVAVDCLITDNILHNLRHALMVKRGSNGNVFSYNYSYARQRQPEGSGLLCDVSLHGHYPYENLFEGNVVEFIELADYWGPTGPRTTFLRNRVQTRILVSDNSEDAYFLGNVMVEGAIETDGTIERLHRAQNSPAEPSVTVHYQAPLPASLYRNGPPANWGDLPWPAIAPGQAALPAWNPAHARAQAAGLASD